MKKRESFLAYLRRKRRLWLIPALLLVIVLAALMFVHEIGFVIPLIFE